MQLLQARAAKGGLINPEEKQLFRLDLRSGHAQDLNKLFTAYELKEKIAMELRNKDAKVLEVRYTVSKSNDIARFEETIRNRRVPQSRPGFNQIKTKPFDEIAFGDLRPLRKLENVEEQIKTQLQVQSEREIKEQIDTIDKAIEKIMSNYLADEPGMVRTNRAALEEVEASSEKVRIGLVILTHPKTYEDFKNMKLTLKGQNGDIIIYLDHPKGNKEIDKEETAKLKEVSPLETFRFGAFQQAEHTQFSSYFDIKELQHKLRKKNTSVKLNCSILRQKDRVKKFDLYVDLFEKIGLKAEVQVAQIDKVTRTKRADQSTCYYLKLKYPVKWYLLMLENNVCQEVSFSRDWKRIENFPILRNKEIRGHEIFRLHLIGNSVIEIVTGLDEHLKARSFLEQLFLKFNLAPIDRNIGNLTFERFKTKFFSQTSKFKEILSLTHLAQQVIWKIKYYVLVLISNNYFEADHVDRLIKLIQENAKQVHVFLHLFEKICAQEERWSYETFKDRFEERKNWPEKLLKSYTDPSGEAVYVWRVNITPSGFMYSNKAPEMRNRLLREYAQDIDHFVRCNIVDDNGDTLKNNSYITRGIFRRMLNEIIIEGERFIPLGWSPSQLRKFSLWYVHEYAPSQLKRSQILSFLGDFCKIVPFAKMAARIGQAFSSSWCYEFDTKPIIEDIPDIFAPNSTMLFTDGIGKISEDLLDKISLRLRIPNLSVIQIRYKGAKGLLTLDTTLPNNTIQLRPSMIKYECKHPNSDKYLDILSWNSFKGGYLNRQIIILLRTLGVGDEHFMTLQSNYVENIKRMSYRECTIYKELTDSDGADALSNLEPANKIIRNLCQSGFELDKQPFFMGILKILKRNGYQKLQQKSNINVDKAARLVGVIDEHKVLAEGEVYCCTDDPFSGEYIEKDQRKNKFLFQQSKPHTVTGSVFVVRNPCLHPGDVRKQRCVSEEHIIEKFREKKLLGENNKHPFSRFTNTVIFSQLGETPVTCEISGSDLDGDNFFICWDESILPDNVCAPHIIQDEHKGGKKKQVVDTGKVEVTEKDYTQMLEFFVDYMNYDKLGKIANSHLVTADSDINNFAYNSDCMKLAIAHGNAVDFPKSGYCPPIDEKLFVKDYPDFMEKEEVAGKTYESKSVLGKLYRDIKKKMETLIDKDEELEVSLDTDLCVTRPQLDFSEKEIQEALTILRSFNQDLDSIIYLFGLTNEFEVYSGNVTSSKGTVAKHSKPLEHIISLKSTYTMLFFDKNMDMTPQKYYDSLFHDIKGNLFNEDIRRKAQLWYVLSYSEVFEDLKYSDTAALNNFKQTVDKVKQTFNRPDLKMKFMGLVWFTIPKVLMDMKVRPKYSAQEEKDEELD